MNRAGHCEWLNTMYRHTPDNGHIINRSWWEEKRPRKVEGREQEAFENRHDLAGNSNLAHNEREVRWINLISMFILKPFPWVQDPFSPDKINTVLRSPMLDNQPLGKKAISKCSVEKDRYTVSCNLRIVHYTILHGYKFCAGVWKQLCCFAWNLEEIISSSDSIYCSTRADPRQHRCSTIHVRYRSHELVVHDDTDALCETHCLFSNIE